MVDPDVRRLVIATLMLPGCVEDEPSDPMLPDHGDVLEPDVAPRVAVDRFGGLRASNPGLPPPDAPIDFDAGFFRRGLGPQGGSVAYYDFGPSTGFTMPVYQLVDEDGEPVENQLPIIERLPGVPEYSDFWQIVEVEVPEGYEPNSISSASEVRDSGYPQTPTTRALNRPVVPEGSIATRGTHALAWIGDAIAVSFDFAEAEIAVRGDLVSYAPIYVCVSDEGTFCVDEGGSTHNVVHAVPPSPDYSPLWKPSVFAESAFDTVSDLDSALAAMPVEQPGLVNCPLVEW